MSKHYKLVYFPVRGRAEFLRYLLAQAGVDYEEQTVSFEEWPTLKQSKDSYKVKQLSRSYTVAEDETKTCRQLGNKPIN